MKIEIDIPDDSRRIRILAGRELIYFVKDGFLYRKVKSCNHCGECCMDSPGVNDDEEGKCKNLVRNGTIWDCNKGVDVPWRCLDDPIVGDYPNCSIEYEVTKVR